MEPYMAVAGGTLVAGPAETEAEFCATESTDAFLVGINISFGNRWRNLRLLWAYCISNNGFLRNDKSLPSR